MHETLVYRYIYIYIPPFFGGKLWYYVIGFKFIKFHIKIFKSTYFPQTLYGFHSTIENKVIKKKKKKKKRMIKTLNKFSLFLRINKIEGEKKSGKYNFISIPELILFLVGI